ncbi:MAG: inorganic phosphate transporter [Lewinellaceae bacterium]|nr:inorganic phosphate transporter [Phaeodactylibacter sp.]MCB0613717.1 inorganic phosphate transporter [Phaeodactylibacter sp.]MCB9350239.1 inorganic phosphate transporter [Lewinellaceae bacterium]
METLYLALVVILFLLAFSDLIVGVSNDAVNFLNSAIGAKAGSLKTIMTVAALGVLAGATFSGGMMEVARKGIFNPQYFYFSEIIFLFLAVMITDVILLDAFNTFGLPTSTTVSIVFELLGAAVAIALIKVYTDPNALPLYEYINSAKALAIISGILLSVVIAFSSGMIIQYLSRALFSFDYEKRLHYFGAPWGGMAIAAITYFMLIKGAKGATFMTDSVQDYIAHHTGTIMIVSFIGSTAVLWVVNRFTQFDILKFIVLIGTFALAMAFAGNDLVNFIGVPLAGFNSYEIFVATGGDPGGLLMDGLAGKVPTPTILLLLAGVVMVVTLWTSKKARSVVKTSLDLGRQDVGEERFASSFLSRSIVRGAVTMSTYVGNIMPDAVKDRLNRQFDEAAFTKKTAAMGKDAPAFDMLRASVTLIASSILIAIGTALKLPLSTTYVTFMVFMGASLADGAWGRESAVYRVTGMFSVIGGWFFTALSAFTMAFVIALIFSFGGFAAVLVLLVITAFVIYRTHKYHGQRMEEQLEMDKSLEEEVLTQETILNRGVQNLSDAFGQFENLLDDSLQGLASEDLSSLNKTVKKFDKLYKRTRNIRQKASKALDQLGEEDLQAGHFYIILSDYLHEMTKNVRQIVVPSQNHVGNNHKPLLAVQIEELSTVNTNLKERFKAIIDAMNDYEPEKMEKLTGQNLAAFFKAIRAFRKNQIKRIQNKEVGTRNSTLFLNHLVEYRNLALFSNRIAKIYEDMIMDPDGEGEGGMPQGTITE